MTRHPGSTNRLSCKDVNRRTCCGRCSYSTTKGWSDRFRQGHFKGCRGIAVGVPIHSWPRKRCLRATHGRRPLVDPLPYSPRRLCWALFSGIESSADLKGLNVITRCSNARPVESHENAISVESINPPRAPHGKGDRLYSEVSVRRNAADHFLSPASERPERHAAFAISIDGGGETTRITDSPHLLMQDDLLIEAARLGRADTHMHSLNHYPQPAPKKIPRTQEQARACP